MENKEYNRLIFNNIINKLANITNYSDLTTYKYLDKYLLEYLLKNNIHTTRMDNYMKKNNLWINLYLKYNIIEPLVNVPLEYLLEKTDNELLLVKILTKMNNSERIKLYQKMKYSNVWLFNHIEQDIIEIYQTYNIIIPQTFINLPKIADNKIKVNKKLQKELSKLVTIYGDTDKQTIDTIINELKRKSKQDIKRTYMDIVKLLNYKLDNKDFKLKISPTGYLCGLYTTDDSILIDKYIHGLFNHELSHLFVDQFELFDIDEDYKEYRNMIKKIINRKSSINRITNYLNEFHSRINFMKKIFKELYFKEVEKQYGSFNAYANKLYIEIKNIKPEVIIIDKIATEIYIDEDNIETSVMEIIESLSNNYANICVTNYYNEELFLENLLDSILKGRIWANELQVESMSGHSRKYYKSDKYASLDECLANYDAIKNSNKADILINKLRYLVGDELVFFLDDYVCLKRGSKVMKISSKR